MSVFVILGDANEFTDRNIYLLMKGGKAHYFTKMYIYFQRIKIKFLQKVYMIPLKRRVFNLLRHIG